MAMAVTRVDAADAGEAEESLQPMPLILSGPLILALSFALWLVLWRLVQVLIG
jgi:hypothetical protein